MKTKYFVIGLLILNLIPYFNLENFQNNNSQPINYSLGFREGEIKTFKICSFDENLAQKYLGIPYIENFLGKRAYVGAYRFILINDIKHVENLTSLRNNQTCSGWNITISSWDWLTKDDWENRMGDPDKIYNDLIIYENPKDLGENFYNIEEMSDYEKYVYDYLNFPYAVPTPVNKYLTGIEWASNWTIDGNKISLRYKESQDRFVEKVHLFNKNGFLKRTLLLTDKGKIIFEYRLESEDQPFYILALFICIAILLIIGIIYIFIKKAKF